MPFEDDYNYEQRTIPPDLLQRVRELIPQGYSLLNSHAPGLSSAKACWIEEFSALIREIDPKGETNSHSLYDQWRTGHWYLHYSHPKNSGEEDVVFGQLVGIANSLLRGTARVVKSKRIDTNISAVSIFHRRDIKRQSNLVFVLMPFAEPWSDYVWKNEIKPIVERIPEKSLVCRRADDLFGHDVMIDIYESIASARIVIADITNHSANVFYELGMAHSLGKDVILLAQGSQHIPFDLNRFRHCIYSNDGPGYMILRDRLKKHIDGILALDKRETPDERDTPDSVPT